MWVAVVSSLPMGTAAWPCRPGVRLSETPVAFAGAGRASTETGIAFAGENWVFLARFSLALVLPVSMGVVHGRALVMVVSRWPVSVVAEVWVVSPSPPQCVLSAKKFALRGLVVGVSAKKFALHAQNNPKSPFLRLLGELFRGWGVGGGVLGELFRGWGVGGGVLGEVFRGWGVGGGVLGELFRACRPHARPCGASGTLHIGDGGGFAALGAGCRLVAGVSHP